MHNTITIEDLNEMTPDQLAAYFQELFDNEKLQKELDIELRIAEQPYS